MRLLSKKIYNNTSALLFLYVLQEKSMNIKKCSIVGVFLVMANSGQVRRDVLEKVVQQAKREKIFSYDLGVMLIPSKKDTAGVTICCHGYGASNQIGRSINSYHVLSDHIMSFNFPDYNLHARPYDPKKSTFGSIQEILPLLYILKLCVIDAQVPSVNLYGFSAGGGAIINLLSILYGTKYNQELQNIGIVTEIKKKILTAVEAGHVILDCPLKSWEEVMALRGVSRDFSIIAERYVLNNMRPIDVLKDLQDMHLTIFLHFQVPDEILSNRDDALFIERLRKANTGVTTVTLGHDAGHNSFHTLLWNGYKKSLSTASKDTCLIS